MNFLLDFLGIRGIVAAIAIGACVFLWWRVGSLQDANYELQASNDALFDTNQNNQAVIDQLRAANDELANGRAIDRQNNAAAIQVLTGEKQNLAARLVQERKLREAIHEPECQELLARPVCPALAERLRANRNPN